MTNDNGQMAGTPEPPPQLTPQENAELYRRDLDVCLRQRNESAFRQRVGIAAMTRAVHLHGGPQWLDDVDPIDSEGRHALSLVAVDGNPTLFILDSRLFPDRLVAKIEFSDERGLSPFHKTLTHKQRVFLLARLALRAEV